MASTHTPERTRSFGRMLAHLRPQSHRARAVAGHQRSTRLHLRCGAPRGPILFPFFPFVFIYRYTTKLEMDATIAGCTESIRFLAPGALPFRFPLSAYNLCFP
jgi:hypothetical protein